MLPTEPTYLLIDGLQGNSPQTGWRAQTWRNLDLSANGLRLADLPAAPAPLFDQAGTFGGLSDPTGIAVDAGGSLYVADGSGNRIYQVSLRAGLSLQATFFRWADGRLSGDRFVYVPGANRVELWPASLERDPQEFSEVTVICETAWDVDRARQAVLEYSHPVDPQAADLVEWQEDYPAALPSGGMCAPSVEYLPCLGGAGKDARQFDGPRGLAITPGKLLYVADSGNHRIQVFRLPGLSLHAVWGKPGARPGDKPGEFNHPWDVAASGERYVYIADRDNARVQQYDCRKRRFRIFDGTRLAAFFFQPRYGPLAGERFVFIPARRRLERWPKSLGRDPQGVLETAIVDRDARSLEDARRSALRESGLVGASDALIEWQADYPAPLAASQPEPPFQQPSHLAADEQGRVYVADAAVANVKVLDEHGRVLKTVETTEDAKGALGTHAVTLDADGSLLVGSGSALYRIHLDDAYTRANRRFAAWSGGPCAGIAVDATGKVYTLGGTLEPVSVVQLPQGFEREGEYISQPLDSDIYRCQWHRLDLNFGEQGLPPGSGLSAYTYSAEELLNPDDVASIPESSWQAAPPNAPSFLVLSPPGRYLWVRLVFRSGGQDTPLLKGMKAFFPRLTYLQYLPAIYSADPVSKDFLERFLSIFETVLSGIESKVDHLADYFDPDGVPSDFLSWLAGWIDMTFDPSMTDSTRRALLRNAPALYRQRGTPEGLKRMLKLAFDADAQVLEAFQLRRWLMLTGSASVGARTQLWGNAITSRLQLEENSRIGEFALVSTGDPQRDPFHVYAHRFTVFIPASQTREPAAEQRIRLMIEQEKPGHTQLELLKVEPRFRVGVQSTLGLDTYVGAYPRLILNECATLGFDSLLGAAPEEPQPPALQVGRKALVGAGTIVG